MTNDTKYNGWTNYATWRVSLENYSDIDSETVVECYGDCSVYELARLMEEEMEERLESDNDLATSYARAFVSDVNYNEIASHIFINALNDILYKNKITAKFNEDNRVILLNSNNELEVTFSHNISINDVLRFIDN